MICVFEAWEKSQGKWQKYWTGRGKVREFCERKKVGTLSWAEANDMNILTSR